MSNQLEKIKELLNAVPLHASEAAKKQLRSNMKKGNTQRVSV